MIVLDASAAVEYLLNSPKGSLIAQRLSSSSSRPNVPHLLDLEVVSTLRKQVRLGTIAPQVGLQALEDLRDSRWVRYEHSLFLPRVWSLRANVTAYDAVYIALAESLLATIITADGKLSSTVGHSVPIEVF